MRAQPRELLPSEVDTLRTLEDPGATPLGAQVREDTPAFDDAPDLPDGLGLGERMTAEVQLGDPRELLEELPIIEAHDRDEPPGVRSYVNAPTAEQLERLIELTIAQRDESARGYAALLGELQAIGGHAGKGAGELRQMRKERLQASIDAPDTAGPPGPPVVFHWRYPHTWAWWKRGEEDCRQALTRIFGFDIVANAIVGTISGTAGAAWLAFTGISLVLGAKLLAHLLGMPQIEALLPQLLQ